MRRHITIATTLVALLSSSCRTAHERGASAKAEFAPNGVPMDWGSIRGSATLPLSAEARLANAAARRLNEAARLHTLLTGFRIGAEITDGIVSVPVKLLSNDADAHNHPYGDGQKNASFEWVGWPDNTAVAPLAMTLATLGGIETGHLLVIEPSSDMIALTLGTVPATITAEISSEAGETFQTGMVLDEERKVYRAVVTVGTTTTGISGTSDYPATIVQGPPWLKSLTDRWAWPRIKVRFWTATPPDPDASKYWPVLFRFPAQGRIAAQDSLPPASAHFAGFGREISLPPYEEQNLLSAADRLKAWFDAQPPEAKLADFYPGVADSGVHHRFTDGAGQIAQTATGGVDTYVLRAMVGKTQVLYTCFDARNSESEAQWGVPSGAGWHSIGHELNGQAQENWTFAETVVNSFAKAGIFAGWGVRSPYPYAEAAPFEAKDVTTFRIVRAGEAFTTAKQHFHWYAIDASQKVCTIIWKHLGCELRSDRYLTCR